MNALRAVKQSPARVATPEPIRAAPLMLTPIPWGKPDPVLGRMVCQHIEDTTPAIVIPFNPLCHQKNLRRLRSHGIFHY